MNNAPELPIEGAKWAAGALCGALAMYLLDPEQGPRRRARTAARIRALGSRTGAMLEQLLSDLGDGVSRVGGPLGLYGVFKPRSPLATLLGLAALLMAARSSERERVVSSTAREDRPVERLHGHEPQLRRIDQHLH